MFVNKNILRPHFLAYILKTKPGSNWLTNSDFFIYLQLINFSKKVNCFIGSESFSRIYLRNFRISWLLNLNFLIQIGRWILILFNFKLWLLTEAYQKTIVFSSDVIILNFKVVILSLKEIKFALKLFSNNFNSRHSLDRYFTKVEGEFGVLNFLRTVIALLLKNL